uniref:Cystatin n=1 Tax=Lepidoglyphus destructor TaxID=36936 RepID=Q8WQ46_LEPDS|nr:cystatin [Lepidoglyphus destructor]
MMCGGLAETKQPDAEVIEICSTIRPHLETKVGRTFETFEPISYRTQVVNGVNYFIKIRVGDNHYVHARVHRAFSGETNLHGYQDNKGEQDELEYIDMF